MIFWPQIKGFSQISKRENPFNFLYQWQNKNGLLSQTVSQIVNQKS